IASSIVDAPVETIVVPMRFNRKKIGLIAAAAAVIIALVIIFPFNNPSGNETVPSGTVNAGLILETKPVNTVPDTGSQPASVEEDETYVAVSKTPAKKQRSRVYEDDPGPIAMLDYAPAQINSQRRFSIIDADEKYMTYTDDEGYVSRLPKKLYDIFECATRELICRQKISDLQSRVASSAVSSDFTGVLEMLRNLQENQ
ncbi:MAG: hypothetical protein ACXWB9_06245, partial [Flavisolibacter sp.]